VVDASDSTINPNASSSSVNIQLDTVENKDPLSDPQVQPRVMARQIPSSTARGQMQLGAPNIFTDSSNRRIMVQDDNQVNTVELGNIGMDSSGTQLWGLKVAQPGVDVTTAADNQLIFNSQQDVFKIVKSGPVSLTIPAGYGVGSVYTVTVNHNLGFIPAHLVYFNPGPALGFTNSEYLTLPWSYLETGITADGAVILIQFTAFATATQLTIQAVTCTTSGFFNGDIPFKYYLLQESLTGTIEGGSVL
jgi:hypothetical protein